MTLYEMKRIEDYFKTKTSVKKKKMDPEQNVELTADIDVAGSSGVQEAVKKSSADLASKEETLSCKLSEFKEKFRFDIGLYQRSLSDSEKHQFLKNCWVPDRQYQFPPSDRNLTFQKKWLNEFPWLAYSHEKCGAFCKFCVIFAANFEAGKGSHVTLRNLVKTPLTKWKKAKENFHDHECRQYHVRVCEAAQNFMSIFEKRQDDIVMQINAGRKVQVEENRKKLTPIIKTVLFCGMEGLPLRGHNESGPILGNREGSDGKFRALIKFRVDAGDEILKHHLESAQTDISGIEQFSLCVRYVDQIDEKYAVREDFLKFVPVTDLRGASLATVLLQSLNDVGLDLKKMRGLGFDGAANMSGAFNGCAAKINEQYTNALYVHCANHSLNLALSHSCSVSDIKNCIGTLKSVITFFRISPKKEAVLKKHIENIDNEERRKRLLFAKRDGRNILMQYRGLHLVIQR
ncbi:zinc finger mym-type protein 1-like protein [Lasius niger]|uniref:Zinc finger mym-type protein 1-like protein n=1 Tax=Lasius niger TaxID=67767 RepID=A0A0J7NMX6_LASNI|nr:zinc finger mym-type protein 1-like protein [Lasius niger]